MHGAFLFQFHIQQNRNCARQQLLPKQPKTKKHLVIIN